MVTNIQNPDAGIGSSSSEQFTHRNLVTGPAAINSIVAIVADATVASAPLPAYSVVKYNTNNELVLAEVGDIPAGITTTEVRQGLTEATVAIMRSGTFNPKVLNFHSSFTTDELKALAFINFPTISLVESPN